MAGGRPQLLNQEIIKQTAELLPRSLYIETVASQLGITGETFRQWLKAGARERRRRESGKLPDEKLDLHCEFSATVKKVTACAEADYLSLIQAAGAQAWQALAWVLERRFPQRWATNRGELRALAKQIAVIADQATNAKRTRESNKSSRKSTREQQPEEVR